MVDEYTTATIPATVLNQMCDGNYQYPTKGGAAVMCKSIILVCGNKDPRDLYPNAWQYVDARFNVICLDLQPAYWINGEPVNNNNNNYVVQ